MDTGRAHSSNSKGGRTSVTVERNDKCPRSTFYDFRGGFKGARWGAGAPARLAHWLWGAGRAMRGKDKQDHTLAGVIL